MILLEYINIISKCNIFFEIFPILAVAESGGFIGIDISSSITHCCTRVSVQNDPNNNEQQLNR